MKRKSCQELIGIKIKKNILVDARFYINSLQKNLKTKLNSSTTYTVQNLLFDQKFKFHDLIVYSCTVYTFSFNQSYVLFNYFVNAPFKHGICISLVMYILVIVSKHHL